MFRHVGPEFDGLAEEHFGTLEKSYARHEGLTAPGGCGWTHIEEVSDDLCGIAGVHWNWLIADF